MEIFEGFSKKFIEEKTNAIKNELSKYDNPIELD